MLRAKGRLVAKKNVKRLPPDEKLKRAAVSARKKLGDEQFNKLQKTYKDFEQVNHLKRRKLEDGLIMSLLQQNLSFIEHQTFTNTPRKKRNLKDPISKVVFFPKLSLEKGKYS